LQDLVRAVPQLYPGKGRSLAERILTDTLVKSELDTIETPEDAQLLVWKLHNAVTAEISTKTAPFPDALGLAAEAFQVMSNPQGQLLLGGLTSLKKQQIIDSINGRWVLSVCIHALSHTLSLTLSLSL